MDLWLILIIAHAMFGFGSFAMGVVAISPRRVKSYNWILPVFISLLVGLVIFMVSATISHWGQISVSERMIFSGLAVLGLYMVYRANKARRHIKDSKQHSTYISDIGFILISLFDGFIIVGMIDLGFPAWLVVVGAVLAVIAGNRAIGRAKKHYLLK